MQNFLLEVMQAVAKSTEVGGQQQLADTNLTTLAAHIEQQIISTYAEVIQEAEAQVQYWAGQLAQLAAQGKTNSKEYQTDEQELTAAQSNARFQETNQQTFQQQSDNLTQSLQNQVGQDSSNMQQKIQLENVMNQVSQALASALASALG